MHQNEKSELTHLSDFMREILAKPQAPIAQADVGAIFQSMAIRPIADGEFPDIEVLNLMVSRLMADPDRLAELEKTPLKPILGLLPYISQTVTAYMDWIESQK